MKKQRILLILSILYLYTNNLFANPNAKDIDKSSNSYWLYIIIIFNVIFLIINILAYYKLRDKIINVVTNSQRIEKYIDDRNNLNNLKNLELKINEAVLKELDKRNLTKQAFIINVRQIINEQSPQIIDKAVDQFNYIESLNKKERKEESHSLNIENEKQTKIENNYKTIYATVADSINQVFFETSDLPNEDTIYVLKVYSNICEFTVFPNVYKRVIENPNKLDTACLVQTLGSSNLKQKPGKAELQQDGNWKITSKCEIEIV